MRFWETVGLILVLSIVGLTYEIAAGRVLAPFFGTSLVTWTTVIATVLAGFSLGSALGGLIAERERDVAAQIVRRALIATAVLMALSPTILSILYGLGARDTGGMVLSVIVAFFPASVLVSFPSPYLAKLAVEARPGREGSSLGVVLAAGSLGAIVGAVLAGFVALPLVGSALTFAACGAMALLCVPFVRGGAQSVLGVIAPAGLIIALGLTNGSVCRYESGLSCIDIEQRDGEIRLYSDRITQAAERVNHDSAAPQEDALVLRYTQMLWARMAQDLPPDANVLFVGGGGYSLPSQLLSLRPEARAVAVEIDPLVTEVVHGNLPWAASVIKDNKRLDIMHADGRMYINETERQFDAAVMDAFSSGSVPAHLVTLETYQRLREIVAGPVYVNLIDEPNGQLARGTHAILTQLYPHVTSLIGPVSVNGYSNFILTASPIPLARLDDMLNGYTVTTLAASRAFTDDRGWIGHR
ncbi:fused MFS/spermidine synthase [Yoonia sp.]|uniref:fused MFS/spermidine synthase n=1 Tax=Yoonia sp. TaxID=2212373 RepID=UPI002E014204|nr:fused MFS/spermidine synthase [Yoonia sp.]